MEPSIFIHKHKYKLAFGLFLSYLLLTMYKIGNNSLWYDECFSIDLGNDTVREIINYSLYNDTNPPFYLLVVHYWIKIFGDSETALRSISAIAGSIACAMFFLFSLRYFNWQTAVFSVLLFFTSNELYYYSEEGRTYGIILMLTVLSNYAFMSLLTTQRFWAALLLGVFNITIFYSHTIACINFVGQVILAICLGFNWNDFKNKNTAYKTFLGYRLKFILLYVFSWLVFGLLFWPWQERFFGIIKDGAKGFWLQKPTFSEYKQVLFEFFNAEWLFFVFLGLSIVLFITLLFVKKMRNPDFNPKWLLIPVIWGPLMFNLDYFAAGITPVFLKRYILFTLPGFLLLTAYLLSGLKINFKLKFLLFLPLCGFMLANMTIPRPETWAFREGVEYLRSKLNDNSFVSTDNEIIFSYYFDRKGAFKAYQRERLQLLSAKNIFVFNDNTWADKTDFSKYTDIYYTRSWENYGDPEHKIDNTLRAKFVVKEDTAFSGMHITHFVKRKEPTPAEIEKAKEEIRRNNEWVKQIIQKARERNISEDSMLTVDAIWLFENK